MPFDEMGMERDDLGRRQPTRFNPINLMSGIPGALAQFSRVVPDLFVVQEDRAMAVMCPCGERTTVVGGSMAECSCERFYLNTGKKLLVANSPESAAP